MIPTWVGSVAFVVWKHKRQQQAQQSGQPLRPLIDVQEVKAIGASLVQRLTLPAPAAIPVQTLPAPEPGHEKRLQNLKELHDKCLISPTEYEAKRQQILSEI